MVSQGDSRGFILVFVDTPYDHVWQVYLTRLHSQVVALLDGNDILGCGDADGFVVCAKVGDLSPEFMQQRGIGEIGLDEKFEKAMRVEPTAWDHGKWFA